MNKKKSAWDKVPKAVWLLLSLGVAIALWLFAAYRWPIVFASPKKALNAFISKGIDSPILWEHIWGSLSECCQASALRLSWQFRPRF